VSIVVVYSEGLARAKGEMMKVRQKPIKVERDPDPVIWKRR
jgi:hypothetical protein